MSRYYKINFKCSVLIVNTAILDGGETVETKEAGEEENLKKELCLARRRIAELEEENRELKDKLLKLDN